MVTKSIFETYVAFIKWPDFQKLEPSIPSPGFQDYAAAPAVTIASKRLYLFIYLSTRNIFLNLHCYLPT